MEVDVGTRDGISLSEPRAVFGEMEFDLRLDLGFDVNRDGTRFLVTRATSEPGSAVTGWILIRNWLAYARVSEGAR